MFKPTGQSLATKGVLEDALGLSTAGVLASDELAATGCTIVPRTLMTKGVVPCPTATGALALATKGILCCPIVIIEEPEPEVAPSIPSVGGGGYSPPTKRDPLKKIKVTVICSGDTNTQEVIVDPGISVDAQILEMFELPENTIFVRVKRK